MSLYVASTRCSTIVGVRQVRGVLDKHKYFASGLSVQRNFSENPPKGAPRSVPFDVQSFNSKDHEFSPYRARETVDRASESAGFNMGANLGSLDAGQGRHEEVQSSENYGSHAPDSQEQIRQDIYSRGEVSLDSVMQSNVPQPFDGTGHEGTSHMNMPGGGSGRANKYLYSNLCICQRSLSHLLV